MLNINEQKVVSRLRTTQQQMQPVRQVMQLMNVNALMILVHQVIEQTKK